MPETSSVSSSAEPSFQRIEALDVIRGIAILGIFPMNVLTFGFVMMAYRNPTLVDFEGFGFWTWAFGQLFFNMKFISLFAILFGAGIALSAERMVSKGLSAARQHYRRMILLLLIGGVHAYLFWYGDILFVYALIGSGVFLFRNVRFNRLIPLAALAFLVCPLMYAFFQWTLPFWPEEVLEETRIEWTMEGGLLEMETAAMQGNWADQSTVRFEAAGYMHTMGLFFEILWYVGPLMILGIILWRKGFFLPQNRGRAFYRTAAVSFGLGLILTLLGIVWNHAAGWSYETSLFLGILPFYFGSPLMAFGYLAGLLWLVDRQVWPHLRARLAAIGRYALSNYLLQTLLGSFIFFGTGLGLFMQLSRLELWGVVLFVWMMNFVFSALLQRYQFIGPAEWILRLGAPRRTGMS